MHGSGQKKGGGGLRHGSGQKRGSLLRRNIILKYVHENMII